MADSSHQPTTSADRLGPLRIGEAETARADAAPRAGSDPTDHDEIRVAPGVQVADLQGEIVLLHPDDGTYFALNETGAHLWRQLGASAVPRGAAVRRAALSIAAEWRVDPPRAEADLRELLDELLSRRLATTTPCQSP
ncbi:MULTISPECIES: PqqD family protein [Pseudofrankia]|uniref:PqqD family protein n=1 Tax=Pseudofrankia TaxID=2994363 RepID=UPI000234B81E|nr:MULTISPECIES: PqqD family peptide modification chaperone [Pseudofrankia]OHV36071.1 hypothetical protein BCD49_21065 [Pseudofrankia sp. EUN1h]